ncbi:uncharacterized protein LOC128388681 [Panonychus citri]|uniref:uncharacterized protein LOC128388681 n=1 Tax=Panonychus citri TaxID=50023 RepID=UPI0023077F34|nr:uncharacterized protein LOC128388681 [Panonychus citri]
MNRFNQVDLDNNLMKQSVKTLNCYCQCNPKDIVSNVNPVCKLHGKTIKVDGKLLKLTLINRSVRSWLDYYTERQSARKDSQLFTLERPNLDYKVNRSASWSTLGAIRPILLSMTLVGLDFIPNDNSVDPLVNCSFLFLSRRKSLYWNYFILIMVVLAFLHNVGCQCFLLSHGAPNDALYSFFSCTKLFCSLLVLILFFCRKKSISQLLIDVDNYFQIVPHSTSLRPNLVSSLRRKVLIDVTLGWSLMILFIYTNFASNISEDDMRKYLHDYWFGLRVETIGTTCTLLITLVETSVYFLATVAPMQFFAIYYILLCHFMKILFHMFNEWAALHARKIKSSSLSTEPIDNLNEDDELQDHLGLGRQRLRSSQVRQFRLIHNRLTKMVYRMDHQLSLLTLLVYIIIMSDLSKYVYYLIERLTKKWEDTFEVLFVGLRVSHMLWLFFNISFSAALMSEESLASASDFHEISSYSHYTFSKIDQSHQVLGILIKLSGTPSQLTGWNLFIIDRGFVLTVLGVVLTYSLVLFQMTPWAQQPGET